MDKISGITALILTCNEVANIERTLAGLKRFQRVIVIDSGSDDGTLEILARHESVEVIFRPFDDFAEQCNFGLAKASENSNWVLSLDADYVLNGDLVEELANLPLRDDVGGYRAHFRYCIFGRAIRCGIYPPGVILIRAKGAHYVQEGHAHRVVVDGRIEELSARIDHDDRKPFPRWLAAQKAYAKEEADHLERHDRSTLRWPDRIRLMVGAAAPLMFIYVFLIRGGFLDGRHGLYYALQRAYAELLLSLELLNRKLQRIADR